MSDKKLENQMKLNNQLVMIFFDEKTSTESKIKKMKYLIKLGADKNVVIKSKSLLSYVMDEKIEDAVIYLSKIGAEEKVYLGGYQKKINEEFLRVLETGDLEKSKLVYYKGAEVGYVNSRGQFPLMCAVRGKNAELVKFLIDKGADVKYVNEYDKSAIGEASYYGTPEIIDMLVAYGANENEKDALGSSLFQRSVSSKNKEVAEKFIKDGVDVDEKGFHGTTAIISACSRGSKEIVLMLIDKGADVNEVNNDGFSGLMQAAANGHLEVVKIMLDNGADKNAKDKVFGRNALLWAMHCGHKEVAEEIANRMELNLLKKENTKALREALKEGHSDVVESLVKIERKQILKRLAKTNISKKTGKVFKKRSGLEKFFLTLYEDTKRALEK